MLRIVLVGLFISVLGHDLAPDSKVVEMDPSYFHNDYVANTTEVWFIMFYSPYCGHCQRLIPTWDELSKLEELWGIIRIGRVDCTVFTDLRDTFGVRGYPTVLLFRNGTIRQFEGTRDVNTLRQFAMEGHIKVRTYNVTEAKNQSMNGNPVAIAIAVFIIVALIIFTMLCMISSEKKIAYQEAAKNELKLTDNINDDRGNIELAEEEDVVPDQQSQNQHQEEQQRLIEAVL